MQQSKSNCSANCEAERQNAELKRLILALADKLWILSQHLTTISERKDKRNG